MSDLRELRWVSVILQRTRIFILVDGRCQEKEWSSIVIRSLFGPGTLGCKVQEWA